MKRRKAVLTLERLEGRWLLSSAHARIASVPLVLSPTFTQYTAQVGQPFRFDLCEETPPRLGLAPNGKPTIKEDAPLCGVANPGHPGQPTAISPKGGNGGPYTFYLNSGTGFPPIGVILNNHGLLAGVPKAAGTYAFQVCAKDQGGTTSCGPTIVMDVQPKGKTVAAGRWTGPITFTDSQCVMKGTINLDLKQVNHILTGTFDLSTTLSVDIGHDGLCPPSRSASGTTVGSVTGSSFSLNLYSSGSTLYGSGGTIQGKSVTGGKLYGFLGNFAIPTTVEYSLTQISKRKAIFTR